MLLLSILLTSICLSLAYPTRVSTDDDGIKNLYSDLLAELRSQQITTGTCTGAGHTSGCCVAGQTGCRVNANNGPCYCDIFCHLFDDCCSDINSIGCLPNTCSLARKPRGCCRWSPGNSCFVPGGPCYCDRFCRIFNDCCPDVLSTVCSAPTSAPTPPPTTVATIPPPTTPTGSPSCIANGLQPGSGCCTSGSSACSVDGGPNGICFCDVMCHAQNNCCHDIQQLNCLPSNCEQAGKLNCVVNPGNQELCNVTTPQGQCYCDANCMAPGSPGDCCTDALQPLQISSDGLLRISQMMKLKQLAQEMSAHPSLDWPETGRESHDQRQRYQAALMGYVPDNVPVKRPREFDPESYGYYGGGK